MIQDFFVENFLSIKDRQGISFLANNKYRDSNYDCLFIPISDDIRLMKLGLLYGYNASGKSNIIKAFDFLRSLAVTYPSSKEDPIKVRQFALDSTSKDAPTSFSITYFTNLYRYIYSLELNNFRIISENLKIWPEKGKKINVFSRTYNEETDTSKLNFGTVCGLLQKEKNALEANTLNNATFFSSYLNTNVTSSVIADAISFFREGLMSPIMPETDIVEWSLDRIEHRDVSEKMIMDLMVKADLQISDMHIEQNPLPEAFHEEMTYRGISQPMIDHVMKAKSRTLFFTHHTERGDFDIESDDESRGTLRYFGLAGILGTLLKKSAFICIDEIESALHPELIDFFFQLFLLNSTRAQIFATTHNVNILDLDYLRHDNYWFCEKRQDGSSEYYSLQDFNIHKEMKISNIYRAGKLGAVPELDSPYLLFDEEKEASEG